MGFTDFFFFTKNTKQKNADIFVTQNNQACCTVLSLGHAEHIVHIVHTVPREIMMQLNFSILFLTRKSTGTIHSRQTFICIFQKQQVAQVARVLSYWF